MDFTISSIILWPKDASKPIRKIEFEPGKVNIITGGSEKGKSAIISIVDYCLGSGVCRIPTRKIRDLSGWFGVLFTLAEGNQILLARKEPGEHIASGEMYMKEGQSLEIPNEVISNYNVADVKARLDSITQLSDLPVSGKETSTGFDSRPSFRDLTSFLFQPQYIIANQSALFYRADSLAHREKLKNIFPYIYQAVDNHYLELQDELKSIERKLFVLEKEIDRKNQYVTKWLGQLRGYYRRAKDYGLLASHPYPSDDWKNENFLNLLREVSTEVNNNIIPTVNLEGVTTTSNRITQLTSRELDVAYKIHTLKHRQELINKLVSGNREYRTNLLNQENRLKLSSWFNDLLKKADDKCPFCGKKSAEAGQYVKDLIKTKNEIIDKGVRLNDNYSVLSGEARRINAEMEKLVVDLNNIRKEIETLKTNSQIESRKLNTLNAIYQFAGKLDAEIGNYDAITEEKELLQQIQILRLRRDQINKEINDEIIQGKIARARRIISDGIKHYAQMFKAENSGEIIEFNDNDLTINFVSQSGRKDSLYEIGSGHNYMSYHISTLLSLHEFFLNQLKHPVPNFIIFDQPTQVYFPESSDREDIEKNEDVERVKRIFNVFNEAMLRTKNNLQIIVLEHVGQHAWSEQPNIKGIKRWRTGEEDDALILANWQ